MRRPPVVPPAAKQPTITEPDFQHAVSLIDAGDAEGLHTWLEGRPQLLAATADEDGSTAGDYFASPRLLWFVAENPIRNGRLPPNIAAITQTLIDLSRQHVDADDLAQQLNYTLALVASGLVPRKCRVQRALIETLVSAGADPNSPITAALAHRVTEACEVLLECGAAMALPLAAGLGRIEETKKLLHGATRNALQEALAMAAINARAECVRLLLERGADPSQYNPAGVHAHSTPLHQAVYAGDVPTVQALVDGGADPTIRDRIFDSSSIDWALHEGHQAIADLLRRT